MTDRTILITRTPEDCRQLQQLVQPCGLRLHPYPVLRRIEISDDAGWSLVEQWWTRASTCDRAGAWLALASPRAAAPFVAEAQRRSLSELLTIPVAAVGTGTAAAATEAGLAVQLTGPGTGEGLAAELLAMLATPTTIVFPCGHHRRPELPDALTGAGHQLLPVEVYLMRATPTRELPALPRRLDGVVITSPRAAKLYLEAVGGLPLDCPHWALGPTSRSAAQRLGFECQIPETPNLESLAEALCQS
jgi:uroporphyrinogen-III synthase